MSSTAPSVGQPAIRETRRQACSRTSDAVRPSGDETRRTGRLVRHHRSEQGILSVQSARLDPAHFPLLPGVPGTSRASVHSLCTGFACRTPSQLAGRGYRRVPTDRRQPGHLLCGWGRHGPQRWPQTPNPARRHRGRPSTTPMTFWNARGGGTPATGRNISGRSLGGSPQATSCWSRPVRMLVAMVRSGNPHQPSRASNGVDAAVSGLDG